MGNVMYARDARHVPGFAVVYVVFGWAARAIHGKCLMLLEEIVFWMTADMNNLKCLYIVISGHQKWNFVICVLIFVAIVLQTRFWSGNASYQYMLNGRSYNLCRGHRGGEARLWCSTSFDSLQSRIKLRSGILPDWSYCHIGCTYLFGTIHGDP